MTKIDISKFDVNEVIDISYMFSNCISLKELNLDELKFSNVIDSSFMFNNCSSLTSLDITNIEQKWQKICLQCLRVVVIY